MRVGDIMRHDRPSVLLDAAFDEICSRFTLLPHNYLYVVDGKGRFFGVISLHDIKSSNPDLAKLVIAVTSCGRIFLRFVR